MNLEYLIQICAPYQQRQSTEGNTTLDMIKQEIVTGAAHDKSYLQKLASVSIF